MNLEKKAYFSKLTNILSSLNCLHNIEVGKFLYCKNSGSFAVRIKDEVLVEISNNSIVLAGVDVIAKILPTCKSNISDSIDTEKIENFFTDIKDFLVRLNHLGVSYSCVNIEAEISEIKRRLNKSNFHLYEEPADSPNQRWFFVGDLKNWENPCFELVLTESKKPLFTKWIPHFHIDLDTSLGINELDSLTRKHFKKDFLEWKLDIPNYGVVLAMGKLSNVNGAKVYLGLGTDIRNTKYLREEILKLV